MAGLPWRLVSGSESGSWMSGRRIARGVGVNDGDTMDAQVSRSHASRIRKAVSEH